MTVDTPPPTGKAHSPTLEYDDIPFLQNLYRIPELYYIFSSLSGGAHIQCHSQDLEGDFFHRVDLNLGHHFDRKHCNPLSPIADLYFSNIHLFTYLYVSK